MPISTVDIEEVSFQTVFVATDKQKQYQLTIVQHDVVAQEETQIILPVPCSLESLLLLDEDLASPEELKQLQEEMQDLSSEDLLVQCVSKYKKRKIDWTLKQDTYDVCLSTSPKHIPGITEEVQEFLTRTYVQNHAYAKFCFVSLFLKPGKVSYRPIAYLHPIAKREDITPVLFLPTMNYNASASTTRLVLCSPGENTPTVYSSNVQSQYIPELQPLSYEMENTTYVVNDLTAHHVTECLTTCELPTSFVETQEKIFKLFHKTFGLGPVRILTLKDCRKADLLWDLSPANTNKLLVKFRDAKKIEQIWTFERFCARWRCFGITNIVPYVETQDGTRTEFS